jgi:hypothetical protein
MSRIAIVICYRHKPIDLMYYTILVRNLQVNHSADMDEKIITKLIFKEIGCGPNSACS